jgi:hypothetical protein
MMEVPLAAPDGQSFLGFSSVPGLGIGFHSQMAFSALPLPCAYRREVCFHAHPAIETVGAFDGNQCFLRFVGHNRADDFSTIPGWVVLGFSAAVFPPNGTSAE